MFIFADFVSFRRFIVLHQTNGMVDGTKLILAENAILPLPTGS
jgi:hypothetical protein